MHHFFVPSDNLHDKQFNKVSHATDNLQDRQFNKFRKQQTIYRIGMIAARHDIQDIEKNLQNFNLKKILKN